MLSKPELKLSIDGSPEFDLTDKIPTLKFLSAEYTPAVTNNYQNSTTDGSFFTSSNFNKNTVNLRFFIHFGDYYRAKAIKQQIRNLFLQKKVYRIRTDAETMFVQFLRPIGFNINFEEDSNNDSEFTIPFENPSGYKFSRFNSLNQEDLWDEYSFNWDIPIMEKEDFHFFNKTDFKVLNPSGVPIDPYLEHHDLKIHFKWTGSHITVENRTNGTSFTYNEQSNNDEIIVLNGCEFYSNGTQVNINSDFGYLKLEPGWNDIRVTGCDSYDMKFEFPFIYV